MRTRLGVVSGQSVAEFADACAGRGRPAAWVTGPVDVLLEPAILARRHSLAGAG